MKKFSFIAIALVGIYSAVLISLEIQFSQAFVRHFFTDIEGPLPFYAINTSLAVFLQLATALMFAVSLVSLERSEKNKQERRFYWSQLIIFGFLALDDRFLFHEKLGARLGIEDAFILLCFGVLEVILLLTLGNFIKRAKPAKRYIYAAATFFLSMFFFDAFLPQKMVLRLSLEDLSKTWADTFLFLFAWEIYCHNITILKRKIDKNSPYKKSLDEFTLKELAGRK